MENRESKIIIFDLKNKNIYEELELYLEYIKVKDKNSVIQEFKGLNINV